MKKKLSDSGRKMIREIQLATVLFWGGMLYAFSLVNKEAAIALAVTGLICTTIFVVVRKLYEWR